MLYISTFIHTFSFNPKSKMPICPLHSYALVKWETVQTWLPKWNQSLFPLFSQSLILVPHSSVWVTLPWSPTGVTHTCHSHSERDILVIFLFPTTSNSALLSLYLDGIYSTHSLYLIQHICVLGFIIFIL